MKLNVLSYETAPKKNRKRVGRGIGSGTGKTCGRGVKGQTSRSGVAINGFEGGQMPIFRRVPKRGFTNIGRVPFQTISLSSLQSALDAGKVTSAQEITIENLKAVGLIRTTARPVKILAGNLSKPLILKVDAISKGALASLEKVGGKVILPSLAE